MKDLNSKGVFIGAIVWIILVYVFAGQVACTKSHSCDAGDITTTSIVALGFLAPAWIVALTASCFFKDDE